MNTAINSSVTTTGTKENKENNKNSGNAAKENYGK
jgi:hypothetical protein